MEADALLKTRRSVRRYRQEPIPEGTLREVVDVARYAPSGGNAQHWEIVLVNDPDICEQVYETLAWLPSVGEPPDGKRPTAYFVVISDKDPYVADCASIVNYLLLAAHARGIGSCWFGSVRRAELAEHLRIPREHVIAFVVALGYPDEQFEVLESNMETDVTVENGVVRVPKLPVDEILHMNFHGA